MHSLTTEHYSFFDPPDFDDAQEAVSSFQAQANRVETGNGK
jgi:hypothetical protein